MDNDNLEIIGRISATEKNPTTIDNFYFWTRAGYELNPFDVVKVKHIKGSVTFGVIDEICHVTDSSSHFTSYISSQFGESKVGDNGNTERLQFNYVKTRFIGNTKNINTPVLHDSPVSLCSVEDIQMALGLDEKNVKNPLICGFLKMYGKKVPVHINANFLVGPDGAHLNISGISGLACKTSYTMFLMNALQQKYEKQKKEREDADEKHEKVAYVMFNVKGRDLLSIDEPAISLPDEDKQMYREMGLEAKPFSNVKYYYPYSSQDKLHNMQTFADWETMAKKQMKHGNASIFKYSYNTCKDKLGYMFANEDDPTGTMENIIAYIENENDPFRGISRWGQFKNRLSDILSEKTDARKTIALGSWKKFNRIIDKILHDDVFEDNVDDDHSEVELPIEINNIKEGEVKVIDIARLDDRSKAFVFGDVVGTIIEMMNTKVGPNALDKIIIFVDELNKYASKDCPKNSPILKHLLDVTERGRSLGIILFSVVQFRSAIHERVKGNCATSAYGRTNFVEVGTPDYRYLGDTYKSMLTRLTQGEYIIQNPALSSLVKINFPRPAYKENS